MAAIVEGRDETLTGSTEHPNDLQLIGLHRRAGDRSMLGGEVLAQETLLTIVVRRISVHQCHIITLLTARYSSRAHSQIQGHPPTTGVVPDCGKEAGPGFRKM